MFFVPGKLPICDDNINGEARSLEEFDSVELSCNVESYRGNWRPDFQCQPESMYNETHESSNGSVFYSHKINVTRDMNDKTFTCRMFLTNKLNLPGETTEYLNNFTWTSQPIMVKCEFINLVQIF